MFEIVIVVPENSTVDTSVFPWPCLLLLLLLPIGFILYYLWVTHKHTICTCVLSNIPPQKNLDQTVIKKMFG